MRKALFAAVSLALLLGAAAPASAQATEPARASGASAYGITATGLLPISPTPVVSVSQPPDTGRVVNGNFKGTIPLDLGGIAVNATINAVGEAARDPRLPATLDGNPDGSSARGFARTEGLSLLGENTLLAALGLPLDAPALLTASAVEAEAVAACVDGEAAFSTDSRVIGLDLLDLDLGAIVDPILAELLNTLNLEGIIEFAQNESGILPDGSGVFVNALRISVLGTTEEIIVGHAEATMPDDCPVPPPAPLAPTGGGPGPGGGGGALAATGSELPFLPLGLGMVTLGVLLNRSVRRTVRRRTI
jgi:hypothetical protein